MQLPKKNFLYVKLAVKHPGCRMFRIQCNGQAQAGKEGGRKRERESVSVCVCVSAEGVLQIFCRVERGMMSHCHMTSFRVFLCS